MKTFKIILGIVGITLLIGILINIYIDKICPIKIVIFQKIKEYYNEKTNNKNPKTKTKSNLGVLSSYKNNSI